MMVADTFLRRLRGIHSVPRQWGVLIPGRSVHGFFLARRLWAVGLDRALQVVGVRGLRPGGLVVFRKAAAVLELRGDRIPPQVGWRLSWKGGVSLWPDS